MSLISIVIPARNEEDNILDTIQCIRSALIKEKIHYEILVVNDGSSDSTFSVVQKLGVSNG